MSGEEYNWDDYYKKIQGRLFEDIAPCLPWIRPAISSTLPMNTKNHQQRTWTH
jgi:hypothetical protein